MIDPKRACLPTTKQRMPQLITPIVRLGVFILAMVLAVACGTVPPPTRARIVPLGVGPGSAGILLVVDVCLNYSPLNADDYFVVDNARRGAAAIATEASTFLEHTGAPVRTRLVPFVCGALHDAQNSPKRFAELIDGQVNLKTQPIWLDEEISRDAEYSQALQQVATQVFSTAVASGGAGNALVNREQLASASAIVSRKTGHSGLVYIGVTGNSLSPGKAAVSVGARAIASMALSLAIGPVFRTEGIEVYAVFAPRFPYDVRQMAGGFVDLDAGSVVRTKVVHDVGDPMKSEVLARKEALSLLLVDMAFSRISRISR